LRRWRARDHHLIDSAPVHVDYFEVEVDVVEGVGGMGHAAEACHDEPGERVIRAGFLRRRRQLERLGDLVDRR
jgi:hypothetical protein